MKFDLRKRYKRFLMQRKIKPVLNEMAIISTSAWMDRYGGWEENPDTLIQSKGMAHIKELGRDTHLSSCYRTRRQSLISKGWHITAAKSDRGEKQADFTRWNLDTLLSDRSKNGFDGDILGFMDAVPFGYSLSEIVWQQIMRGKYDGMYGTGAIKKKDVENYGFRMDKYGNILPNGVIFTGNYTGSVEELPVNKFVHVVYGPDDENPYGESSTSKVAFWIWMKKNSAKFWAVFAEKFSMPLLTAKQKKNATSEDKDLIDIFIKKLQSKSGIRVPESFELEFLEATRSGDITYDNFIERCNKEISKEVLGATMAIEEGSKGQGSYAHASVNADILHVYTFFDEIMVAQAINNQLIKRLIDYNYLGVEDYPKFSFKRDWFADIVKIAQGLEALGRMGVGIPVDWIYSKTGIPKPKEGEEITSLVQKVVEQQAGNGKGVDNRTKVVGGFSIPVTHAIETHGRASQRELNFFEKRAQFEKQERVQDALELSSLQKASAVMADVFSKTLNSVSKKIESVQGTQLLSLPNVAVNIGDYKNLLVETAFQYHLTAYYFAKKEIESAESFASQDTVPVEIGTIKDSIKFFQSLIPKPKSWFEKLFKTYDERFFHVAGLAKADIEKIFNNALIALEDGWTLNEFKSVIGNMQIQYTGVAYGKDQTGKPLKAGHLQVIHRNNMGKAYRAGQNALYNDPDVSDTIWGYTYSAIMDSRVREDHAKLDGITLPKTDAFWQKYDPPWDHNCRCMKFAVTFADIENEKAVMTEKLPAIPVDAGW